MKKVHAVFMQTPKMYLAQKADVLKNWNLYKPEKLDATAVFIFICITELKDQLSMQADKSQQENERLYHCDAVIKTYHGSGKNSAFTSRHAFMWPTTTTTT